MSDDIRKTLGAIDLSKRFAELVKFRVPTGIVAFDRVLSGGVPAGKLTEIYGPWSSGKSRLACHIAAETQRLGGMAVYLDNERSLDQGLIDLTGLNAKKLIYPDPDKKLSSIEDVFTCIDEIMEYREKNGDELLTIVWDSVAATPGIEDIEKEIGRNEASMRRAKLIGDGLKKMMITVYSTKTVVIFINQIRDKIGVMWGEKTETVGGKALKYASSLRIHVELIGKIKDEKTTEIIGNKGRLTVDKSKVGKPFGMVNWEMMVDNPINPLTGLLDYMVRHDEATDLGRKKFAIDIKGRRREFHEDEFPEVWAEMNAK